MSSIVSSGIHYPISIKGLLPDASTADRDAFVCRGADLQLFLAGIGFKIARTRRPFLAHNFMPRRQAKTPSKQDRTYNTAFADCT